MPHSLKNTLRREDTFFHRKIDEVMPEHILENHPKIVSFLEEYYNFLDSDGAKSFQSDIYDILSYRDTEEIPNDLLNLLVYEIGSKLENVDKFDDERFALGRLPYFYRDKGSAKATEEFFRLFFQTDVEIEYPKKDIFLVGEDEIGPDYEHYIQDYAKYQTYSILLKVGLSVSQYQSLYKKFAHPAGWYFQGEVSFTSEASLGLSAPISLEDSVFVSQIGEAYLPMFHQSRYTHIVPVAQDDIAYTELGGTIKTKDGRIESTPDYKDSSEDHYVMTLINTYQNATAEELSRHYTIGEIAHPNSRTFDEDSAGDPVMSFDNEKETMDEDMFTRYDTQYHYR